MVTPVLVEHILYFLCCWHTLYSSLSFYNVSSIVSFGDSTICIFYSTGCPSPPPMFSAPPTILPGLVRVSWTAAGSSDPLVTGIRYALYSRCGSQTTFQLIDDITGLSYDITTLPTLTQCTLRVVVYGDHCLLDVNGSLEDTTDPFTTGESEKFYCILSQLLFTLLT